MRAALLAAVTLATTLAAASCNLVAGLGGLEYRGTGGGAGVGSSASTASSVSTGSHASTASSASTGGNAGTGGTGGTIAGAGGGIGGADAGPDDAATSCPAGHADCDGNPANGCEASLDTDTSSCGACGHACTNAHGTTACSSGTCAPTCAADFFDCDGDPANGCETAYVDDGTCGTCAHHCTGSLTCQNGQCVCLGDNDCNGGTTGHCGLGVCFCYDEMGTACSIGQRCSAFGACGYFE